MDISDIGTLLAGIHRLLAPGGTLVFATQHPCFVTLTDLYLTPHTYLGDAIPGQPVPHNYHHRSLQDIMGACFKTGFIVNGLMETGFPGKEIPDGGRWRSAHGAMGPDHAVRRQRLLRDPSKFPSQP